MANGDLYTDIVVSNGAGAPIEVPEGAYAIWTGCFTPTTGLPHNNLGGGTLTIEIADADFEASYRTLRVGGTEYSTTAPDCIAVYLPDCLLRTRMTGATDPSCGVKLAFGVTRNRRN